MPKLTPTQTTILKHAAKRADGAIEPFPDTLNLKGGARTKVIAALERRGLASHNKKKRLVMTDGAREAIGIALTPTLPRSGTKPAIILGLIERTQGAGIDDLMNATGWQAHSVRAALTGLRKKGIAIERVADETGNRYRAARSADAKPSKAA